MKHTKTGLYGTPDNIRNWGFNKIQFGDDKSLETLQKIEAFV
jgi:hypothetical protein